MYSDRSIAFYLDLLLLLDQVGAIQGLGNVVLSQNETLPSKYSSSEAEVLLNEELTTSQLHTTPEVPTRGGGDGHAQWLSQTADNMYKYGMTCTLVFGAVGNSLVIVVLVKGKSSGTTSAMYLLTLAVLDQSVIVFAVLGRHVIRSFTGFDYILWHRATCKTAYFIIVACAQSSFYLVATMSLERALVMWRPLRFLHVFTRKRVAAAICFILGAIGIKNSLKFWTQGTVYKEVNNVTVVVSECGIVDGPLRDYALWVRPWVDYLLMFSAASVIAVANLLIIIAVWRSKRLQKETTTSRESSANKQASHMVVMLVAVSVTFLVMALPLQIVIILVPNNPNDVQSDSQAQAKLLWSLGLLLSLANHGINFYVYCLSGRTFREDFLEVMSCFKSRSKASGKSPNQTLESTVVTSASQLQEDKINGAKI